MANFSKLSRRASTMPASPIRRLAPLATAATAAGKRVHHLNIGQPDIPTPRVMLDQLRRYDQPNLAYGPSEGLPAFIAALCKYYDSWDLKVAPSEIFVTTGGSEALMFVIGAVADDGDEVLVFEPFYTNYNGFAQLVGVKTVPVTTRNEDGYHMPQAEEIESKITSRTRAILLCSPNNPTGTVYSREELDRVAKICRERGLYLIADEVYREFTYDGRKHISALTLSDLDQQVIVVDSLSKRVSMCGARIGWIVSRNQELMAALLKFGQARLCPPTVGQLMGSAIGEVPESYIREVIAEYQLRRDLVYEHLKETPGVTLRRPEGAFYVCAKIPVDDAGAFAEFMLRDFELDGQTVMVAPADGFYATPGLGRDEVRIAYVLDRDRLSISMRIVAAALEAFPGRR